MMIVRRHTLYAGVLACAAFVFSGCASTSPTQQQPAAPAKPQVAIQTKSSDPSTTDVPLKPIRISADTCEMRLHDLCGPLLYYLITYQKFPDKLEDLRKLPMLDKDADFNCPITHQPYGYVPEGLAMPDGKGGVLVYDRDPHNGIRWAIEIVWPEGAPKPLAMVIPLTEETFRALKANP